MHNFKIREPYFFPWVSPNFCKGKNEKLFSNNALEGKFIFVKFGGTRIVSQSLFGEPFNTRIKISSYIFSLVLGNCVSYNFDWEHFWLKKIFLCFTLFSVSFSFRCSPYSWMKKKQITNKHNNHILRMFNTFCRQYIVPVHFNTYQHLQFEWVRHKWLEMLFHTLNEHVSLQNYVRK